MSKEVIITNEVRLALAKEDLEKTNRRLKLAAGATATMAIVKGGLVVGPKALAFLKGSVMFMGCLPIPNYFTVLAGGLVAVDACIQVIAYKARIKEEKAKNKTFSIDELFMLEDEDD